MTNVYNISINARKVKILMPGTTTTSRRIEPLVSRQETHTDIVESVTLVSKEHLRPNVGRNRCLSDKVVSYTYTKSLFSWFACLPQRAENGSG